MQFTEHFLVPLPTLAPLDCFTTKPTCPGRTIVHKGRVVFGAMDEVVFGHPAAEAIVAQMDRLGAARAFLMVSGTLNRQTGEIEKIRKALGPRCVATFDAMPPHTPREAVIAAAEQARVAGADLIVTVGGGSITDGAKAVQLCLANDVRTLADIERIRTHKGVAPPMNAPTVRQMLAQALPRVKANPGDLDARMDCQIGTWLSMAPLSAGVPMGASHGIGYVLGALFDVPHGYTSCVMLPSVMRWNKQDNAERQALVSEAMGQPGKDAADVLDGFIRGLGLPPSLRAAPVSPP